MKTLKIFLLLTTTFLLGACFWTTEDNIAQTQQDDSWSESAPKYILALGDSLTAGYSLPIEDSYPSQLEGMLQNEGYNYELINAGVSGNTSAQALERLDLYLEDPSETPELAIVVVWWNDGLRGQSIDTLENNLTQIVEKLQERWVKVVIWWMQIPPNRGLKYFSDFKWVYKKVAKATDAERIDFFLEDVATKSQYNLPDWIHPNKEGYAIISQNVFNFLEKNKLLQND